MCIIIKTRNDFVHVNFQQKFIAARQYSPLTTMKDNKVYMNQDTYKACILVYQLTHITYKRTLFRQTIDIRQRFCDSRKHKSFFTSHIFFKT